MTHMTKDLDGICDMKDSLMRKVRGKMDDLDVERSTIQDVQGMDMMINMIHHLAEAEKCCWEACYYKTVVKAMKEGDDPAWRHDDHDPGRAAQPPQDGRRDHVEGRHSRATQAHQGESHQVVDHVDRLMRR